MVSSVSSNDTPPGVTAGGVQYSPGMQTPTSPNVGTDGTSMSANLIHPNIQIDGAFAVDDTSGS